MYSIASYKVVLSGLGRIRQKYKVIIVSLCEQSCNNPVGLPIPLSCIWGVHIAFQRNIMHYTEIKSDVLTSTQSCALEMWDWNLSAQKPQLFSQNMIEKWMAPCTPTTCVMVFYVSSFRELWVTGTPDSTPSAHYFLFLGHIHLCDWNTL